MVLADELQLRNAYAYIAALHLWYLDINIYVDIILLGLLSTLLVNPRIHATSAKRIRRHLRRCSHRRNR